MADPSGYAVSYSFSGFQESNPADPLPAPQLDNELFNISAAFTSHMDAIKDIRRSDGALVNGIVTTESLAPDLLSGIRTPTTWVTATSYAVGDTVFNGPKFYSALIAHTSGTFATDLAAGKWSQIADFTPPGTVSATGVSYSGATTGLSATNVQVAIDQTYAAIASQIAAAGISGGALAALNSVDTAHIDAGAVTLPKIASAAVGTAQLVDASVTAAKLAPTVAMIPIGALVAWTGPELPALYLWARGQTADRTAFASLFAATTMQATATRTSGSASLSAVSKDATFYGLVGAAIEGTGIQAGTVISAATSTTITMSKTATSSGTAGAIRILPHGGGDGVTTFNVIDMRGAVAVGRDNMAGAAAGLLTGLSGGVNGAVLGASGGEQAHTSTVAEMPLHGHPYRYNSAAPGSTGDGGIMLSSNLGGQTNAAAYTGTLDATGGHQIGGSGGGGAHNNVQPSRIINYIVYAGA